MTDILICQNCEATTAAGVTLCFNCCDRLVATLQHIEELETELHDTFSRLDQTYAPGTSIGGGGSDRAEPVNRSAAEVRSDLRETLAPWREYLQKKVRANSPAVTHPAVAFLPDASWLAQHIDIIRLDEQAGQLYDEVMYATGRAERVVDLPPDRVVLGGCGVTDEDGVDCTGTICGIQGHMGATCDECGAFYSQQGVLSDKLSAAWDQRHPLSVIVKALALAGFKIRLDTAKKWVSRGDLTAQWKNSKGVRLYTMSEVWEVYSSKQSASV